MFYLNDLCNTSLHLHFPVSDKYTDSELYIVCNNDGSVEYEFQLRECYSLQLRIKVGEVRYLHIYTYIQIIMYNYVCICVRIPYIYIYKKLKNLK